jgi:hypothetical protein
MRYCGTGAAVYGGGGTYCESPPTTRHDSPRGEGGESGAASYSLTPTNSDAWRSYFLRAVTVGGGGLTSIRGGGTGRIQLATTRFLGTSYRYS